MENSTGVGQAGPNQNTTLAERLGPPSAGLPSLRDTLLGSVREPADPDTWEAICMVVRLVVTPDGRALRTIITGRRRQISGVFSSRKAGRGLAFESMNEHAFFHHSEVDTNVVDYLAQPFRFEFVLDGTLRTYIADCVRQLADGSIEVVEVKQDYRALKDPEYALKLHWVREICRVLGWSFRVVHGQRLRERSVLNDNVQSVQQSRFVQYSGSDVFVVADACRQTGAATLGVIADAFGDARLGRAKAYAMMVGRLVDIQLDGRLSPQTPVRWIGQLGGAQRQGGAA
jgi:hypothetical protein